MSDLALRRGWAISIAATVGVSIAFLDRQTMAVLAPVVTKALHITDVEYGWLGSVFALALFAGSIVAGWFTTRLGPRRAFLFAVLVWSLIAVMHSLAAGFLSLLLLRAALGLAESPTLPAALETVERALPAAARPRATGLLFVGSSVGVLVAAPIAVALEQQFGWRVAFITAAGFAALLWAPAWWAATAVPAMTNEPDRATRRDFSRSLAALAHPAAWRCLAVMAGVMPLIAFTTVWEGKWLVGHFKLPPVDLGTYLLLGPILFDIGAFLFGDLASRRLTRDGTAGSPRVLFSIALALIVGGDLAAAFAPSALFGIAFNGCAAVGRGAILPLAVADMTRQLPPDLVAGGSSAVNGMQALSMVIALPIIGYVVKGYGYPAIIAGLALWAVLPCGYWLVSRRMEQ